MSVLPVVKDQGHNLGRGKARPYNDFRAFNFFFSFARRTDKNVCPTRTYAGNFSISKTKRTTDSKTKGTIYGALAPDREHDSNKKTRSRLARREKHVTETRHYKRKPRVLKTRHYKKD